MSIIPAEKYPGKTAGKSPEYPLGKARNISSTGDGSGTPLEQAWVNDLFGFQQAVLKEAEVVASGAPDTALNSQLLQAMKNLFAPKTSIEERLELLENAVYEDTKIGEHIWTDNHFATPAEVAEYKGYGTWARALQGRVAVGFSAIPDAPADFTTPGKEYGEKDHTLTVAEMPSHKHTAGIYGGSITGNTVPGTNSTSANDPNIQTSETGGGLPHNNMQPSKTLDCWKRTA